MSTPKIEQKEKSRKHCKYSVYGIFSLVRPMRFERTAYRVGVCHSIQLSYGRIFTIHYLDQLIINQLVYYTNNLPPCKEETW